MTLRDIADRVRDQTNSHHAIISELLEQPEVKSFISFLDGYWDEWQFYLYDGNDENLDIHDLGVMMAFLQSVGGGVVPRLVYAMYKGLPRMYILDRWDYRVSWDPNGGAVPLEKWKEEVKKSAMAYVSDSIHRYDNAGYGFRHYITLFRNLAFTPEMMEEWLSRP